MEQNTPKLWDAVWANARDDDDTDLVAEKKSVRWTRICEAVVARFGSWNIDVVELGAGSGTYSMALASLGARVTLVDYSERALSVAKKRLERRGLHATYRCVDLIDAWVAKDIRADVTMSFGLAEHFSGPGRKTVLQRHLDLLRTGGMAIVSVPNAWCLPYRVFKLVMEVKGEWRVGEEYPFTHRELHRLLKEVGARHVETIGGSYWRSFRFLAMLPVVRRLRLAKKTAERRETASLLDKYMAYELVALASS